MSDLTVTPLRNLAAVDAIASDWQRLAASNPSVEIFATYEWLRSWWEIFGGLEGRELMVLAVRQGATLVGLAPFLIRPTTGLGPARSQRVEFIGTGEDECDEVCSDFLDVLAAPGKEDEVCREVWSYLGAASSGAGHTSWDEALFRNVLASSALARSVGELVPGGLGGVENRPAGERFYVSLEGGSFDAYVEGLSKKRKKRIFYYRRRLEKEGGLEMRQLTRREDIPLYLAETARLSRLRRGSQGKPTAWDSQLFQRFQAAVAPRLWERGWLDLRLWWKQGRCVAALYGFVYADTFYYYQSGWDTAAFGNVSPGLVTLSQLIEWGFGRGLRRFDFLVGTEGSYKEDYDCKTEPVCDLRLYNNTLAGQLVRSARGVRHLLRGALVRAQAARAAASRGLGALPL